MRIITDSAADFTREELGRLNIMCVRTQVMLGDEAYTPGVDLDEEGFWEKLNAGLPCRTSQPAPDQFIKAFEDALADGEEAVYISISSALSGTLQSALIARSMLDTHRIHVVDSLTGAAAQKLLVLHACRLRDEGHLTAKEIAEALERLRTRVRLFAGVDTLDNLSRSGRIPKAAGHIGNLTHLKPLLHVTPDGLIGLCGTAFGRPRALDALAKKVAALKVDADYPVIPFYTHTQDNCLSLIKKLTAHGVAVNTGLISAIGPAVAGHIGPGAWGVTFVEAE